MSAYQDTNIQRLKQPSNEYLLNYTVGGGNASESQTVADYYGKTAANSNSLAYQSSANLGTTKENLIFTNPKLAKTKRGVSNSRTVSRLRQQYISETTND